MTTPAEEPLERESAQDISRGWAELGTSELELIQALYDSASVGDAAALVGYSERQFRRLAHAIRRKVGARSLIQLVADARLFGLVGDRDGSPHPATDRSQRDLEG